ncbi:MAG: hypothetical protein LBG99_05275 [Propionibacteriaceae bacterium]|jgi:hypothetical protein|nr:hypothetical protein [Propionibacteriaceae bacterium]
MPDLDNDGIDDAIEGQVRIMMGVATQIGERIARSREQQLYAATQRSHTEGQRAARQVKALNVTARYHMTSIYKDQWWDTATADDISQAWAIASSWPDDPEMVRAHNHLATTVESRYGFDPRTVQLNHITQQLQTHMQSMEQQLAEAELKTLQGAAITTEENHMDPPKPLAWDSTERKDRDRQAMKDAGVSSHHIWVKETADVWHGPPSDAALHPDKGQGGQGHARSRKQSKKRALRRKQ